MSTIGSVSFDIIRGLAQNLKTRTQAWETPGIAGYGALRLGEGDGAFELTAIKYAVDNAAALVHTGSVENLQGGVYTLTDDHGDAYPGVLIISVETSKRPVQWNGNAAARRLEYRLKVCTTA